MKTLLTRAVSALFAIGILVSIYFWLGVGGFKLITFVAVIIGSRELLTMLFPSSIPNVAKNLFYFSVFLLFLFGNRFPEHVGLIFSLVLLVFFMLNILFYKVYSSIQDIFLVLSRGLLGLFYLGLLPLFACETLNRGLGIIWFAALLSIVFAGDTLAYLCGLMMGKTPISPLISPKKTVEGALGGLVGSTLVGGVFHLWIDYVSLSQWLIIGFLVGVVGQVGDLFESLLKRIADVKDSGSLMPGHGGILDRIDGVLFGAPVIFLFTIYFDGPL